MVLGVVVVEWQRVVGGKEVSEDGLEKKRRERDGAEWWRLNGQSGIHFAIVKWSALKMRWLVSAKFRCQKRLYNWQSMNKLKLIGEIGRLNCCQWQNDNRQSVALGFEKPIVGYSRIHHSLFRRVTLSNPLHWPCSIQDSCIEHALNTSDSASSRLGSPTHTMITPAFLQLSSSVFHVLNLSLTTLDNCIERSRCGEPHPVVSLILPDDPFSDSRCHIAVQRHIFIPVVHWAVTQGMHPRFNHFDTYLSSKH